MFTETEIKLTAFSHGAGCGCKISPKILNEILHSDNLLKADPNLLVGNDTRDDAAVYDLGTGEAIISTTDFFMPIVDDAFDFGRIAAANAISDIYAMGGRPLMAIAILGWPVNKIPASIARQVLEGSRAICAEAGITLAGGHSIDSQEPIFGLSVNGLVKLSNLKKNSTAIAGCKLYLTKKLGVGILSTAQKMGILTPEDAVVARDSMIKLNNVGEKAGALTYVKAMTDVTGFGLLGHLIEMCEGSGLQATIDLQAIPFLPMVDLYLEQGAIPGGTIRNIDSYGHKVNPLSVRTRHLLADPQTSGGLLIAIDSSYSDDFEQFLEINGFTTIKSFGTLHAVKNDHTITCQE